MKIFSPSIFLPIVFFAQAVEPHRDLCVELRWLLSEDSEVSVAQREARVKHCYEMEKEFTRSVIIRE
jgi:hypothetical protein